MLDVEREIRSDIHEITAKAKKPFQDHFWKDHFCDSGSAAADRFFLQYFPLAGNPAQIPLSLVVVKPIPIDNAIATMVIFLWENPQFAIICMPDVKIVPNIMIVHPPSTD